MTLIKRAYRAISRAYRLHLPEPKWAAEILEKKTSEIERNIVDTLDRLKKRS